MAIYALSTTGDSLYRGQLDADPANEFVRVEADSIDSPVTRVINTGNELGYEMATEEIERLKSDTVQDKYSVPSPRNIAAGILGGGATVNPVG